jgi:Uma2 family endonuclease
MSAEPVEPLDPQDMALAGLMHTARHRSLTLTDIADLDRTVGRVELLDGNLIVTPAADFEHQDLCVELVTALNAIVPAGLRAYTNINLFEPGSDSALFIPDVAVVHSAKAVRIPGVGEGVFPDAVELIMEITSTNREVDMRTKRDRFAGWHVPYVVVDRQTTPPIWHQFGQLPEWVDPLMVNHR